MNEIVPRSELPGGDEVAVDRPEREELGGLEIDDNLALFCIEQSCSSVTTDLDEVEHVSRLFGSCLSRNKIQC